MVLSCLPYRNHGGKIFKWQKYYIKKKTCRQKFIEHSLMKRIKSDSLWRLELHNVFFFLRKKKKKRKTWLNARARSEHADESAL